MGAALAAFALGTARPAGADTLTQQRDKIVRARAQLRVQLNLAVASDGAVRTEDARLARLVTAQTTALGLARAELAAAEARAADAQRRVQAIQANATSARRALVARAVDLYEHPFASEAAALAGVGSINEYAERQELVTAVEGRTSDVLDAFRQQQIDEQVASRDLVRAEGEADGRRALLQQQEDALVAAKASADRIHAGLQRRIADLEVESRLYAAQEASVEAKLAASEASFGGGLPLGFHGALIWPLHGPVTQEFGYHAGGFHPGIDIAAPYGTPIHASGTGVVVIAGWEGGYGNYTCISHGGGIATCYGHQSAIYVSVGQHLVQGQVIGAEGSTGYSTGPHVHFEVRVNNTPNNPRNFIPGNP
jgi:murein DD-endopeptidase MepM/ murein hydrolase activator NlpD